MNLSLKDRMNITINKIKEIILKMNKKFFNKNRINNLTLQFINHLNKIIIKLCKLYNQVLI